MASPSERTTRSGKSWVRAHRPVLLVMSLLLAALVLAHLAYLLLGHAVVAAAYRGDSPIGILNEAIHERDAYPVERYLLEADILARRLSQHAWRLMLWIGAVLFLFSAARPWRWAKVIGLLAVVAVAATAAMIVTRARFDADSFRLSVDRRLEENQALAEKAALIGTSGVARMRDHPINGYYYLLDEHLGEVKVEDPSGRAGRDAAVTEAILAYEFDQPGELGAESGGEIIVASGVLLWKGRTQSLLTNRADVTLPVTDLGRLEVRIRMRSGTKLRLALVNSESSDAPRRRRAVVVDTAPGPEFQVYSVDLRRLRQDSEEHEVVDRIEFVLSDSASGDTVELDYVRFFRDRKDFDRLPVGLAWETSRGETRRVIHAWTGLRLAVDVELPAEPVTLTLGAAVFDAGQPVRFLVKLVGSAVEEVLWSRELAQSDGWSDVALDLTPYGGRQLELAFETTSAQPNVALWGHVALWSKPRERSNVIILLEDTLRADHLSGYGYSRPTSPQRDRFAATGAMFENAFSQETKTRPSVPSLMTSLYPTATGVWNSQTFSTRATPPWPR